MINSLIAFQSFDELFGNISINPNEKDVVIVIFFVVEFVIKVFMDQIVYDRILCFEESCNI